MRACQMLGLCACFWEPQITLFPSIGSLIGCIPSTPKISKSNTMENNDNKKSYIKTWF